MKKLFPFIFLILVTGPLNAQTNAVWNGYDGYYHFKTDGSISFRNSNLNNYYSPFSFCKNNGEMILIGGSKSNDQINNKAFVSIPKGEFLEESQLRCLILRIDENKYMLINTRFDAIMKPKSNEMFGFHYSIIDLDLNNGYGGFVADSINVLFQKTSKPCVPTFFVKRKNEFNYWLYSIANDSIYIFSADNSGIALIDGKSLNTTFEPYKGIPNFDTSYTFYQLIVSGLSNDINIIKEFGVTSKIIIGKTILSQDFYRRTSIEKYHFDDKIGRIINKNSPIILNEWKMDTLGSFKDYKIYYSYPNAISDNDSFIYLKSENYLKGNEFINPNDYVKKINQSVIQLNILSKKEEINELSNFKNDLNICGIKLGVSGEIFIYSEKIDDLTKKNIGQFDEIINANFSNATIKLNKQSFNIQNSSLQELPVHVKDYIQIKYDIKYDCEATVIFQNKSVSYRKFDKFTWFINKKNGEFDTLVTFQPILYFKQNGNYGFKILGQCLSDSSNYSEWYTDTLKIHIPPKPVANFLTKDTIVCRFAPLSFVNFSTTKDIHPTNPQKWVWTFGDGETITTNNNKSVTHTYKLPRLYTVSLFYSNGYCDSTLVRNQYIKVVDAPVPGFSVKDTIGCAPFVAQFTDTTYENITKKEYFFSDNNNWETITTQQFSHTFNQAGKFRAVQRLYGFSGCITQSDSVWFYVSAGLTQNDTLHATVASYLPNNSIELNWTALSAAVAYGVYKANNGTVFNNNPFTVTTSTSIIDTLSTPSLVAYKIVGIDSCGSLSAAGRKAQPILLQGKVADKNTMAILTFTPYSQWQDTLIKYQIEHFIEGNWMVLTSQTDTQQVIDKTFRQDGAIDKCYRIKATNTAFTSYSNNLCLPCLPMLFVPNAFSPNNDGINDVFKPITYGIVSYELKIYNRWGQQIALLHKDEVWEAKDIPQGAYYLQLSAIAVDGSQYFANEVIHLVR